MEPKNRLNQDSDTVISNINRVRERPFRLKDERIILPHGAGGKSSAALVEAVFYEAYGNEELSDRGDAAVLSLEALGLEGEQECEGFAPGGEIGSAPGGEIGSASAGGETGGRPSLAYSTDSYVVNPIQFPGGSIGDLAINGTVNDLSMMGAIPKVISVGFILEEGLEISVLRSVVEDMHEAAQRAGVKIVTGDTKVVAKGAADQIFINTSGIGVIPVGRSTSFKNVQVGDRVIVSGPIADHGVAVMLARGDLAIQAPVTSDTREVSSLVQALYSVVTPRWMRDATRGGVATVLNELAHQSGLGVSLQEHKIPIRDMTRAACDMLGIDPLYFANEGTFIAVVAESDVDATLDALHQAGAPEAASCGEIVAEPAGSVVLSTGFGGVRMVDMLAGDPLPRIC